MFTEKPIDLTLDAWVIQLSEGHNWGITLPPHSQEGHPAKILFDTWIKFINYYQHDIALCIHSKNHYWEKENNDLLVPSQHWSLPEVSWQEKQLVCVEVMIGRNLVESTNTSVDELMKASVIHLFQEISFKKLSNKLIYPIVSIHPDGISSLSFKEVSDHAVIRVIASQLTVYLPAVMALKLVPPIPHTDIERTETYCMDIDRLEDILGE